MLKKIITINCIVMFSLISTSGLLAMQQPNSHRIQKMSMNERIRRIRARNLENKVQQLERQIADKDHQIRLLSTEINASNRTEQLTGSVISALFDIVHETKNS